MEGKIFAFSSSVSTNTATQNNHHYSQYNDNEESRGEGGGEEGGGVTLCRRFIQLIPGCVCRILLYRDLEVCRFTHKLRPIVPSVEDAVFISDVVDDCSHSKRAES